MFIKYPKIHRLGKDETVGILQNHEGIKKFFEKHPNKRLFGEWLVKHTIQYKETAYKQMFLFDIMFENNFLPQIEVEKIAYEFDFNYPQIFGTFENPTEERIKKFVGKSNLGDKGEGIVIKNLGFKNKFGDLCYAKIVTQKFKIYKITKEIHELFPKVCKKNNLKGVEIDSLIHHSNSILHSSRIRQTLKALEGILGQNPVKEKIYKELDFTDSREAYFIGLEQGHDLWVKQSKAEAFCQRWLDGLDPLFDREPETVLTELRDLLKSLI